MVLMQLIKTVGKVHLQLGLQRIELNIETANYDICYDNMKNIELRRFEWDSEYMPNVND